MTDDLHPGDAIRFGKDWMSFIDYPDTGKKFLRGWNLDDNGFYHIVVIPSEWADELVVLTKFKMVKELL